VHSQLQITLISDCRFPILDFGLQIYSFQAPGIRRRRFKLTIYNLKSSTGLVIHIIQRSQFHQLLDIAGIRFFKDAVFKGGNGVHF
jgi:hypothetical protein